MTGDLRLTVLGSVLSVPVQGEDLDRLRGQWSRCLASADQVPVDQVRPGTYDDADRRDYSLASSLTMAGIRQAAGSRLMLHACGVADLATGDVAVLVAASGTGKTTAAQRLCAAGFGYVTDETVSVGDRLDILPYPKPLSVVIASDEPGHKSQHGPDELGLAVCPPGPRATRFVLLARSDDTDGVRLEHVALLDGLLDLIPHTSALPAMRDPLWTLARAVVDTGGVWRLHYRDIEEAAQTLGDALRQRPSETAELVHLAPPDPETLPDRYFQLAAPASEPDPDASEPGPDTVVRRASYTDAVGIDDEVLLLVGASPARLSGLGATIWAHSAEEITLAELTQICVGKHGDHPDSADLVRDAVQAMRDHGVLDTVVAVSRPAAG